MLNCRVQTAEAGPLDGARLGKQINGLGDAFRTYINNIIPGFIRRTEPWRGGQIHSGTHR